MPSMPWRVTLTGASSTNGWPIYFPDYMIRPFNIGIGCVVNSTGVTYNVEHTFDDITLPTFTSSSATWFQSTITAKSTNQDGSYAFPVSAIRLNATAASSIGTVTINLIQAG
jgi:hypothetical protein